MRQFGSFIEKLAEESDEPGERFWAFISFVSDRHASILTAEVPDRFRPQVEELLAMVELPEINVEPGHRVLREQERAARRANKKWWQFWI